MSKSKILSNPWVVAVLALFCAALWGSATPFIKIGYELILPEKNVPSTILFAGVRFFFAGVITVLIYSIASGKLLYPQKANIGKIAQVSVFQTVLQYIFFYVGLANTSGVKGTILSGTSAFFSLLIASLIFKQEKLTPGKIIGCISGFAGIIFVNLNGLDFTMNFTGDCFVLFSAVALGFSSVLMKKYSKDENPVVISGYQFIMGGIAMVLIGIVFGGKIVVSGGKALGVLTYLSFLSTNAPACATERMGTPMTIGTPTAAGIAAKGSPATDAGILKWNSLSQRHLLSNSRNPGRSGRSFIIIWRTRAATRSRSFKFEADCGGHACRFLLP